jgi:hypothetical protein
MPADPTADAANTRKFLLLIWVSPILMTLLGVAFLFMSSEKPWLPWLAFALALVSVFAAIRQTRKTKAEARAADGDEGTQRTKANAAS